MLVIPAIKAFKRKKYVILNTISLTILFLFLITSLEIATYMNSINLEDNSKVIVLNSKIRETTGTNTMTTEDFEKVKNIEHIIEVEKIDEFGISFGLVTIDKAANYSKVVSKLDELGYMAEMQNADLEKEIKFVEVIKNIVNLIVIAISLFMIVIWSVILNSIKLEEKGESELLHHLGYNPKQLKIIAFLKNMYICYKSYIFALLIVLIMNPIIDNVLAKRGLENFLNTNFLNVNIILILAIFLLTTLLAGIVNKKSK